MCNNIWLNSLLEWEIFQTKVVEKVQSTPSIWNNFPPRKSCLLWDNLKTFDPVREDTDINIKRRMRIACWINKATNTHSEYVILIAFPLQQWLYERASMLRLYIHCLFCFALIMSYIVLYIMASDFRKTPGMSTWAGERLLYWAQQFSFRRRGSRRLTLADKNVPVAGGHMMCICIQVDIGV